MGKSLSPTENIKKQNRLKMLLKKYIYFRKKSHSAEKQEGGPFGHQIVLRRG